MISDGKRDAGGFDRHQQGNTEIADRRNDGDDPGRKDADEVFEQETRFPSAVVGLALACRPPVSGEGLAAKERKRPQGHHQLVPLVEDFAIVFHEAAIGPCA